MSTLPAVKNGERLVIKGCRTQAAQQTRWEEFQQRMRKAYASCGQRAQNVAPYAGHAENCGTLLVLRTWDGTDS